MPCRGSARWRSRLGCSIAAQAMRVSERLEATGRALRVARRASDGSDARLGRCPAPAAARMAPPRRGRAVRARAHCRRSGDAGGDRRRGLRALSRAPAARDRRRVSAIGACAIPPSFDLCARARPFERDGRAAVAARGPRRSTQASRIAGITPAALSALHFAAGPRGGMIDRLQRDAAAMFHVKHSSSFEALRRLLGRERAPESGLAGDRSPISGHRHIVDGAAARSTSADARAAGVDIGTGAGLPGLVIAILTGAPMTLIEPRRLRADFLRRAVDELGLDRRGRRSARPSASPDQFDVITARAVGRCDSCSQWPSIWPTAGRAGCFPRDEARRIGTGCGATRRGRVSFSLVPSRTHRRRR